MSKQREEKKQRQRIKMEVQAGKIISFKRKPSSKSDSDDQV